MQEIRDQLASLDARLRAIEERLGLAPSAPEPSGDKTEDAREGAASAVDTERQDSRSSATAFSATGSTATDAPPARRSAGVTELMAWSAAAAFVLAAVYFVKLVYDSGWLTPERQIGLALLAGAGLIALGLQLARFDRAYAAYLPAAGLLVLYVAVYAAHVYHGLVGPEAVVAGVGATTLTGVWLYRTFGRGIYVFFAVTGTYMLPVLVPSQSEAALDLIVYFAAWGLLFSWIALHEAHRAVYLLALWFSLLGFDFAWRLSEASDAWVQVAVFQFCQFLLFSVTAALYSARNRAPMGSVDAVLHGLALFVFYGLEWAILKENAPTLAPAVALASVAVVVALYVVARSALPDDTQPSAGAVLVSSYASVVTAHVFLLEILPESMFAWGVLLLPLAATGMRPLLAETPAALIPIRVVAGLAMWVGLQFLFVLDTDRTEVPLPLLALFLYVAVMYVVAIRQYLDLGRHPNPPLLLYAGHVTLMVTTVKALSSALAISGAWAALAVALLVIALRNDDRVLGRSSLLVFAAFVLKVLLYDLNGSATLVRVGTLVILGASLYLGGWLYQRVGEGEHTGQA